MSNNIEQRASIEAIVSLIQLVAEKHGIDKHYNDLTRDDFAIMIGAEFLEACNKEEQECLSLGNMQACLSKEITS